jgi:hypothetical protein
LRAGGLDHPVNLRRVEPVRAMALGFLADYPEHFRLGGSQRDVIPDADR